MSYGLSLAGDAMADLGELDPWLQEEVLDELERLTATAPAGLRVDRRGEAVHDFARMAAGTRHVVFMRLHVATAAAVLTLLGVRDWTTDAR